MAYKQITLQNAAKWSKESLTKSLKRAMQICLPIEQNLSPYIYRKQRKKLFPRYHYVHRLSHLRDVGFMHQAVIRENSFQGIFSEDFGE